MGTGVSDVQSTERQTRTATDIDLPAFRFKYQSRGEFDTVHMGLTELKG